MISNVGRGFLERMFTDKPAEYYFDTIVLSSDVNLVKPDRRIYELTAVRLNLDSSECVFIDDLEPNVRGAEKAGMKALQYRSFDTFLKQIEPLLH